MSQDNYAPYSRVCAGIDVAFSTFAIVIKGRDVDQKAVVSSVERAIEIIDRFGVDVVVVDGLPDLIVAHRIRELVKAKCWVARYAAIGNQYSFDKEAAEVIISRQRLRGKPVDDFAEAEIFCDAAHHAPIVKKKQDDYKGVPIIVAREIAQEYSKDQVIIVTWDGVHRTQHVTTYGRSEESSAQAAQGGNFVKQALGWPERLCHDLPEWWRTDLAVIEEFVKAVNLRAEQNIEKTHKLEGSHYAAMTAILNEMRKEAASA